MLAADRWYGVYRSQIVVGVMPSADINVFFQCPIKISGRGKNEVPTRGACPICRRRLLPLWVCCGEQSELVMSSRFRTAFLSGSTNYVSERRTVFGFGRVM